MLHDPHHPTIRLPAPQPRLQYQPIHLIHDQTHPQPLLPRLPQHRMRLYTHTLHRIHQHKPPIRQPHRRTHLATKIHVPRRIDQIVQVLPIFRFRPRPSGTLALAPTAVAVAIVVHADLHPMQQTDTARLHRNTPHLLILQPIHVPQLPGQPRMNQTVAGNQVIRQRRLAMVHVRKHTDVTDRRG